MTDLHSSLQLWLNSPLVLSDVEAADLHAATVKVLQRLETHAIGRLAAPARDAEASLAEPEAAQLQRKRRREPDEQQPPGPPRGELVLLGSGIKAMVHLTREAMVHLRAADVVFGALNPTGPDRRWLELTLGRPVIDLNQFYPDAADADLTQD